MQASFQGQFMKFSPSLIRKITLFIVLSCKSTTRKFSIYSRIIKFRKL